MIARCLPCVSEMQLYESVYFVSAHPPKMTKKSDRKFVHNLPNIHVLASGMQKSKCKIKFHARDTSQKSNRIFLDHIRAKSDVFPHFWPNFPGHFSSGQPVPIENLYRGPIGIILPYRNVTKIYPINIESNPLWPKPSFYMAEPHISIFVFSLPIGLLDISREPT